MRGTWKSLVSNSDQLTFTAQEHPISENLPVTFFQLEPRKKMPEAANEGGSTNAAKNLTDEQKELVRKTWKEAAKPEVQAGQKLFKK